MTQVWQSVSNWFWDSDVWLPKGYEWQDLTPNEKVNYSNWTHLWTYPFVMALAAIFIRFIILNKLIFGPIASASGLRDVCPRPPVSNELLEQLFRKYNDKPSESVISSCASKVNWSERKVERWLRQRKAINRVNKYTKFMECCWQMTYYTTIFMYGLYVMSSKPWLKDIKYCWYDYPHHSVDNDVWWYYMLSLAFYWSMTFTHFMETKRKDFWQMFFHHLVTIALIVFSWTCNLTRVGTIILILHDCADIPLQAAKIFVYLQKKALCDAVFALFAILWLITRIGIYPLWVIKSTMFEATEIIPLFPAYYIFNGLLVLLFVLHIYWTYFILRIIVKSLTRGRLEDERSSSDESLGTDDDSNIGKNKKTN